MSDRKQLRTLIEREMVHAPNVRTHRDDLNDRINNALLEIGTLERWTWLDKLATLRALPPLTLTDAEYTVAPGGGGPAAAMSVSFPLPDGYQFQDPRLLAGHTINWGDDVFVIERSYSLTFMGNTTVYIVLDPRFDSSAPPAGDIVFNMDRYRLPSDIAELYSLMSRSDDQGPLQEIALKTEEWLYLNRDEPPGEPNAIMASPNIPALHDEPWIDPWAVSRVDAPLVAPTLTGQAGGSLNVGQEYEYYYVWYFAGMVSAPSPVAKITLGAGQGTVDVGGLETAQGVNTLGPVGRERWIFRRTLEGPWRRVLSLTEDSTTPNLADNGSQQLNTVDAFPRARQYLSGEGHYRHMRLWPPPATHKDIELRYLSRVPKLEADSDVPFMPPEFRNVIVHYIARDLSATADNERLTRYHDRRYNECLRLMRRRGLISDAQRHIRRSMFNRPGQRPIPLVQPPVLLG